MLFCFLAPPNCSSDPRIEQILKEHIKKNDVFLYDDLQPKPYEISTKKLCEARGIKTKATIRPTMTADLIYALFKDDFDIVKNR